MNILDIFHDDAFTLSTLTGQINNMDHVPGRAGDLVFAGISKGIGTDKVSIERVGEDIHLIATSARGAPAEQERQAKRDLLGFEVPQIKLEQTIKVGEIQDIAAWGVNGRESDVFNDRLRGAKDVVARQMNKMAGRHDLTLEYHRLGALKGKILDADNTVLVDLFEAFGFLNTDGDAAPEEFDFQLDDYSQSAFTKNLRQRCSEVVRVMTRNAKTALPTDAKVWALCGDNFYDKFLEHPSYKKVWDGTASAESALGDSYVDGVFEFGGIFFENYRGTDDNSTVAIDVDEARFFWTGAPELYSESFAPGDFIDAANTVGLPRYARMALDPDLQQWIKIHTQQNPLPLCVRPATLCKAT